MNYTSLTIGSKVFVAVWRYWETTEALCVGVDEKSCLSKAQEICEKDKIDPNGIEIEEVPFTGDFAIAS